ncbi:MAG TPA: homoserine dehydrogenase, partial [Hyphomicrobiales bacterium]
MEPLRIGVAGLGIVGVGVLKLLAQNGAALAQRCGRPIEVRAVCARDRSKHRGVPLDGAEWFPDPVSLAAS